jgi:hypothetical protein
MLLDRDHAAVCAAIVAFIEERRAALVDEAAKDR